MKESESLISVLTRVAGGWMSRVGAKEGGQYKGIIGNPMSDLSALDGAQSFSDTCAVKAQEVILQQFFCRDFDESALRDMATQKGWYTPGGGTPLMHMGRLLEEAGIPISQKINASGIDLFKALSEGKKVIVGVDGNELRNHGSLFEKLEEFFIGPNPDHAVLVSGLDCRNKDDIGVFITDPATNNTVRYSMSTFFDAWRDSACFMVQTNVPAPEWCEGMSGFDYSAGHLSDIEGVSYDVFDKEFSALFSSSYYTSSFDLMELVSVMPKSYIEVLSLAVDDTEYELPDGWETACLTDKDWLADVTSSFADAPALDVDGHTLNEIASELLKLMSEC